MAENTINDFNTLPEQVQLNKEDIKKLSDSNTTQTEQLQTLTTKVDTNTANIATNNTNIDNLSKKVYDNGTISFYLDSDLFIFKDQETGSYFHISLNNSNEWLLSLVGIFSFDCSEVYINRGKLNVNGDIYTDSLYIHNVQITKISNSNDSGSKTLLTSKAINDTFLTKTDASNTYATKTELNNANKRIDALDTGTLNIDLTTSGLAKLQANPTIGTSISLTKDSDFSEFIDGVDTYETILFSIYTDQSEDYYISANIKLDVGYTADIYGDNDKNYTWLTGIGVIKLGNKVEDDNQYLCYISYSKSYTTPLFITPIKKLA